MRITISVVLPIHNEEKNISLLYKRLRPVLLKISKDYEILYINDGSTDNSFEEIQKIRKRDKNVKLINFSRNFGHMAALNAGLKFARGEKVVLMDADLQDPPEIILKFYNKSLLGFDIVYGVKTKRKEGMIRKGLFKLFYKILHGISAYKIPMDSGTFSLINKRAVTILKNLPEKNQFLSGLRAWVGFNQTGVVYARAKRFKGKPASFSTLVKLAMDGFLSFSYVPLRIASYFGFFLAGISFLMIIFVISARIFFGWGLVGWASTLTAILFMGGIQLITLGIIGEYLARIYDQVKNRPEYIISEKYGL